MLRRLVHQVEGRGGDYYHDGGWGSYLAAFEFGATLAFAHLAFWAAEILARPAALILPLGFFGAATVVPLIFAHLANAAALIFARPARLIFHFFRTGVEGVAVVAVDRVGADVVWLSAFSISFSRATMLACSKRSELRSAMYLLMSLFIGDEHSCGRVPVQEVFNGR